MQTQPRKRRRSPSPLSSNNDKDSDTDHEKQAGWSGSHDGHRRKPTRSHSAQMRMREGRGQHGDGNSSYDTSSDSEDSDIAGDHFAALDQFAVKPAQSKSAPIDDKYEEAISAIAKFFDGGDKVSDNVQDSLASIFESALRRQPNDKMLLDIVDKYPRPKNIPNLTVPKTNDCVWDAMKRGPQVADAGLQKIQTVISKSLVPVISIIDNIGQPGGSDRPIAHYLEPLTDVVRLSSQARKDIIRNDMGYPISKLCNWKYKVGGDQLFEDDLMKKLRELKEQHTQFKNPWPGPSSSRFGGHRSDRDYYRAIQSKPFKRYNKKKNNLFNKSTKFPKKKRDCEYDVSETQNVANVTLVTDSHEDIHDSSHTMSSCEYDLHNTSKNFKGGKLSDNYDKWLQITSDKWILDAIEWYAIEFSESPCQNHIPPPLRLSKAEQEALDCEISEFIKFEIIEECMPNEFGSYYSNLFTRDKRDGSKRAIINLKGLTPTLEKHHFKMETIKDVILMMRQNCSFASIDFKHAFFSVKIKNEDRKYLRFKWQGKHYQFTCLPQGLGPASRVFTKILKPAFAHLRGRGIEISGYIDDSISVCDDHEEHELQIGYAVQFFDQLGFTINIKNLSCHPITLIP